MSEATDAATDAAHMACVCGSNHRLTGSRSCPAVVILHDLHVSMEAFLDAQDILEFGEEGPMLPCLLEQTTIRYQDFTKMLTEYQTVSEQHPEWHLATEISRLRSYFKQVADYYVEKIATCRDESFEDDGDYPVISGNEEQTLLDAKRKVQDCYSKCYSAIEEYGIENLRHRHDPNGSLPAVDKGFKDALDAIMLLPAKKNVIAQELSRQLYNIRNETRRLFKFSELAPSDELIYQSEVTRLYGRPARKRVQKNA